MAVDGRRAPEPDAPAVTDPTPAAGEFPGPRLVPIASPAVAPPVAFVPTRVGVVGDQSVIGPPTAIPAAPPPLVLPAVPPTLPSASGGSGSGVMPAATLLDTCDPPMGGFATVIPSPVAATLLAARSGIAAVAAAPLNIPPACESRRRRAGRCSLPRSPGSRRRRDPRRP